MKKIAVGTIKSFLKENASADSITISVPVGENAFELAVRTKLTTDEKSTLIRRVVSGCFDAAGDYRPEYFEPVLRATILQICTNLPPITMRGEPDALDLDAMDAVYCALNLNEIENDDARHMFMDLRALCEDAIQWRKNVGLHHTNKAIDDLLWSAQGAVEKLSEKIGGLDMDAMIQYAGQLSKATSDLGEGDILKGLLAMQRDGN